MPATKKRKTAAKRKKPFIQQVAEHAEAIVKKHGQFNSMHEAFGVMWEEVDEFWEEVRKKRKNRRPAAIRTELMQIAAICVKAAEKFGAV